MSFRLLFTLQNDVEIELKELRAQREVFVDDRNFEKLFSVQKKIHQIELTVQSTKCTCDIFYDIYGTVTEPEICQS